MTTHDFTAEAVEFAKRIPVANALGTPVDPRTAGMGAASFTKQDTVEPAGSRTPVRVREPQNVIPFRRPGRATKRTLRRPEPPRDAA